MSIRTKILLILLLLSVPPILFLRISGMRSMDNLSLQVQTRTSNLLMENQSQSLQRIVEDHARLLKRERQLIGATLEVLVTQTAAVLEANHFSKTLSSQSKSQHSRMHATMHRKKNNLFLSSPSPHIEKALASLLPTIRKFSHKYPKLILWQKIELADSSQLLYSANEKNIIELPHHFHSMMPKTGIISPAWSIPMHDKVFDASVFTASQAIILSNDMTVGSVTIAVPVSTLLRDPGHLSAVSSNITSYVINADIQKKSLLILAQRNLKEKEGKWFTVPDKVLEVPQEAVNQITKDILANKSRSWVTKINGRQYLTTYAPLGIGKTALLISISRDDIIREASKEKDIIHSIFSKQMDTSHLLLGSTLFLICIAATYFSHSLSKNIYKLVECVRQIGKGNLSTQVTNVGTDEIGELGSALNEMIPALKENVHLKTSLQLASEVQKNLLPKEAPQPPSYDIAGASYYCTETGGDYFDFISCVPENASRILMAVGDVVGHGVPAALLMATARAYLRSSANHYASLAKITHKANELVVCDTYGTGQFMTLFFASLDTLSNTFTWTRAGHDAAIIYRRYDASFEELKGKGATALGVIGNTEYMENATTIHKGDLLVIATDGLWECVSPDGVMFGKERMKKIIEENSHLTSQQLIDTLYDAALKYSKQSSLEDDFTCIVIQRKDET